MRSTRTSTGVLLAIGAAFLFAINGNVSKVALENGISSLELVSMRSAGTALILLVITAVRDPASLRVSRRELRFMALYGLTGIAMVQWLYFVAIQRMPVGIALLFEYTAPLMVALWVRFVQKEPVKSRLWLGPGPDRPGQRSRGRRRTGLLLPDGRAWSARTRPDLADGLLLWLLGHPVGHCLALAGVPLCPAHAPGRSARRSARQHTAVADGVVDRCARNGHAIPSGPGRCFPARAGTSRPDRHARARRGRHHRLGPARRVPQQDPDVW